jgi:phage baseplate assembly protein V
MWRRGIVKQVDAAQAKVKVLLPDEDGLMTDWLPVLVPGTLGLKVYRLPRKESQVVVLLDECGEDGAVLGCLYSKADPAPANAAQLVYMELEDGTKIQVDPVAKLVKVETPGSVEIKASGHVNAEAPTITLKGSVTVDGTLAVTQAASLQAGLTVSQDATIGGKSFLNHQHQAQGATAITTKPV